MHQLFSMLWQAGQWIFADPRRVQALLAINRATQQYYRRLSPETRAKVDAIIRWGVKQAVKHALGDVLGEVAHNVVAVGAGEKVAEFAQTVVVRGVEVGVEKALAEANG